MKTLTTECIGQQWKETRYLK